MFRIISKSKSYKSACPHEVSVIGVLRTCKVLVHGGEGGQGKLKKFHFAWRRRGCEMACCIPALFYHLLKTHF